jgi:hypothetical protein
MRALSFALTLLSLLLSPAAGLTDDGLLEETVRREVNLRSLRNAPEKVGKTAIDISGFKGRYQLETECFRRLLPLSPTIRRCIDAQRAVSGELHTRLDFAIEPSGKLRSFAVRATTYQQLQACLAPHTLALSFPRFSGQPLFELQVLVASPGATLGGPGRRFSKALPVYPIGTPDEQRTYAVSVMWVFSPWSMAIDRCAELVDQTLGFGYRFSLAIEIAKSGRAQALTVEAKGKLASKAIDPFVRCAAPFVKAIDVPPHTGPGTYLYRKGTTTAGWGIR